MHVEIGRPTIRGTWRPIVAISMAVVLATGAVSVAESGVGVTNASALYLLAVIAVAGLFGTWASIATAIVAFLVYDYLFVSPTLTLTASDPAEWLELLLLLVVGIVVGQLAGLLRARAEMAVAREREAHALFAVSRALASERDTLAALPLVVDTVAQEARMDRVWVSFETPDGRPVGDHWQTDAVRPASHAVLRAPANRGMPTWTRVHAPGSGRATGRGGSDQAAYRVPIDSGGTALGSLWATRPRAFGWPSPSETRLMAAAADQVAAALEHDRLAAMATEAEVARRSDALKTALLDSVSHDLRTPLASIRAAAGTLMDPVVPLDDASRVAGATAIDREAERLNRLVANLLDMSRIEGGSLQPSLVVYVLEDLVAAVVSRTRSQLHPRVVALDLPPDLPPVLVDSVYLDQVLTNLLENIARYTPPETHCWVRAQGSGANVRLSIEDDGPGVPPAALPHLFEKFYRVSGRRRGSTRGIGIGLSVARGLLEAMGGTITASDRTGGGLAFEMTLIAAPRRDMAPEDIPPTLGNEAIERPPRPAGVDARPQGALGTG